LFKFLGVGTEKVESEIARLFPAARVARLDSDTARKRGVHEKILSDFRAQKIDILVGTQMIAKGFDFHHVTLVGIVNADTGLLLPDFRSSERTFQLLTQMAGRTGRGREPGKVFVQTQSPLHYSIQHAAKHEYPGFFSEELERRREFQYPPFTRLINVACRGKNEQAVEEQSVSLGKLLKTPSEQDRDDIEVLGPAPLPLYRLRGHYRWHVMLRGPDTDALRTRLRQAIGSLKRKTGVFVAIDVDPISIL
jgi:primosomal protein N' (replication factor Y) (superfamily II helicase)